MKRLFLNEIRECIGGHGIGEPDGSAAAAGVSIDSRNVAEGDIFFAIRGERFDGHQFVAAAFECGAAGAVVERLPDDVPADRRNRVLRVDDTVRALGRLAACYRKGLSGTVIAVTGSNGKTTTRDMIHHVLSKHLAGKRSIKSYNNHIGVPLTLLDAEPGEDFLVVEAGSNHPGEIDYLGGIIRPDIAVITQVAETHLEGFGTIEHVAAEKASLAKHVTAGGAVVVNGDREMLLRLIEPPSRAVVVKFGQSEHNDLRLTGVKAGFDEARFSVNDRFAFRLPAPGRHNAFNAVAAIAVARRMGLEMDQIATALEDFRLPSMRLEVLRLPDLTVVNDAYNANPTSMASALETLGSLDGSGRVVFFCGDMRELGPGSERFHRELGQRIAAGRVNVLLTVGSETRATADEAMRSGLRSDQVSHFANSSEAAEAADRIVREGDTVLLKGSRSIGLEAVAERLKRLRQG